jgi:hypothetical protein
MEQNKFMNIQTSVNQAIFETTSIYQKYPYFFLSERDAQAYLYSRIINTIYGANNELVSDNRSYSTPVVHCEILTYDADERATTKPDITILDIDTFKVGFSKNDIFEAEEIINIEIKLGMGKAKRAIEKDIIEDYEKLCEEYEKDDEFWQGICIIFDLKNNLIKEDILKIQENTVVENNAKEKIRIIYVSPQKTIRV